MKKKQNIFLIHSFLIKKLYHKITYTVESFFFFL